MSQQDKMVSDALATLAKSPLWEIFEKEILDLQGDEAERHLLGPSPTNDLYEINYWRGYRQALRIVKDIMAQQSLPLT